MSEIDTFNKFFVAGQGEHLVFLRQVPMKLTHEDALNLAAYLVAMVGDDELWERTLNAIQNT